MAVSTQLINALADAFSPQVARTYVAFADRALVSAGLRSKAGRGAAAAQITVTDAVHLIIGVAAPGEAKEAPVKVGQFGNLEADDSWRPANADDYIEGLDYLYALNEEHTFYEFLEAAIYCFMHKPELRHIFDGVKKGFFIEFSANPISVEANVYFKMYQKNLSYEKYIGDYAENEKKGDLVRISQISSETLGRIAEVLKG